MPLRYNEEAHEYIFLTTTQLFKFYDPNVGNPGWLIFNGNVICGTLNSQIPFIFAV